MEPCPARTDTTRMERSDLRVERAHLGIWRAGRSLSLLVALAAPLVLAACGSDSPQAAAATSTVKTPTAARTVTVPASEGSSIADPRAATAARHRSGTVIETDHVLSTTNAPGAAARVSRNLASFGGSIQSPRGPYRGRPTKLTFVAGGNAGSLWIDHLTWVDWGQPIAYASGIVHARAWPSANFITTAGGVMLDQLRLCGTRSYYTMAVMLAPAGYPANSQATATGETDQALTPCR
jgi:hypothetical protein